ncbi:MAG: glycosyltransferase family 4 protein [Lentisphaeria bacterium]
MKSAHKIIFFLGRLGSGGAERVGCILMNEWVAAGRAVHLVTLYRNEKSFYPLDSRVTSSYLLNHKVARYWKWLFLAIALQRYRRYLKQFRPDAVVSFMTKNNLMTLFATLGLGVHAFISDRNNPVLHYGKAREWLCRWLYPYAAGVIAQTQQAAEITFQKTGVSNVLVTPNPLQNVFLHTPVDFLLRKPIILNVGRCCLTKGQHLLIDMFAKLAPNYPEWQLRIIGDGAERSALEQQCLATGCIDRIELLKPVKDIENYLAETAIFAFASSSEGFPNALAEAMAMGCACVSFDCDTGPRDLIVDGENGFLVPTGDLDLFTRKLELLMRDPDLRMRLGENARKIRTRLSGDLIAERILGFID